jgi:hypothetical protein
MTKTTELAENIKMKIQPFVEESGITCEIEIIEGNDIEITTTEYFDFDFISGINDILSEMNVEFIICPHIDYGVKMLIY